MIRRATEALADLRLRYLLGLCLIWALSLLAYLVIGESTVGDSSALVWIFRVLLLGGGAVALLVTPAVLIARVFRRAWREMGLPPVRNQAPLRPAATQRRPQSHSDDPAILGVMSRAHVELVQRADDAMRRGDVEALIELCSDDVLLLPARSALHGGYTGAAGLRKFFLDNAETFELFTTTWDETHDAGEQVVMIGHVTARPLGGGPEATVPAAMVVTLEHGKIARVEDLRDRSAALASVGLQA